MLDEDLRAVRAGAGSTLEAIERMTHLLPVLFLEQRAQMPILFEFWTQARREPVVWQAAIEPYRRYQAFFAGMIRDGIAEGAFKPADAEVAAQALVSLVIGLLLQSMVEPADVEWGNRAQASVGLFLKGLAAGA